ncbi:MAG: hypothetical protein IH983_07555 [Planctomycetes bacterium]|nr:hypothetical protein [Planctomycetota bacterium]
MPEQARIRVNFSLREIEIAGDRETIEHFLQRFDSIIDGFKAAPTPTAPMQIAPPGQLPLAQTGAPPGTGMPAEFGEYLHQFADSVSEVDRVLIAASFVQANESENSFRTRDANALLQEQGIRLGNASECVRRNVSARRVFSMGQSRYRLSRVGLQHLQGLRS